MDDLESNQSATLGALRAIEAEAAQANSDLSSLREEVRGIHDRLANLEAYQARASSLLGTSALLLGGIFFLALWLAWKLF